MATSQEIPKEYVPIQELDFCRNLLIGGGFPIGVVDDFAPLIIGSGVVPQIWLYARHSKKGWETIIEKNISQLDGFVIEIDESERRIKVDLKTSIHDGPILQCTMESDTRCSVDFIDLRTLGFELFGDKFAGLMVGDDNIYDNEFTDSKYIITIGG